jgi:hypothetical protein
MRWGFILLGAILFGVGFAHGARIVIPFVYHWMVTTPNAFSVIIPCAITIGGLWGWLTWLTREKRKS